VLVVTAIVVILQNGTRIASPAETSTHFFKSAISDTGPPTPVVAISLSAGRVIQQRGYPVTEGNGVGDRVEAIKTSVGQPHETNRNHRAAEPRFDAFPKDRRHREPRTSSLHAMSAPAARYRPQAPRS